MPLDKVKFAAARLVAADLQPFLAVALYALTPLEAPGLGTFAVDERWRLFIDPDRLGEWSVQETAAVLLHEVSHVVRDHAQRARDVGAAADEERFAWNIAADAEINDDLVRAGAHLPPTPVLPKTLRAPTGRAAEHYYWLVQTRPVPVKDPPRCGPGATGEQEGDERFAVDIGAAAGVSGPEAMLLRRRVAEAVLRGRAAGAAAGGWTRWAEATLAPRVDWRALLRSNIRNGVAAVAGAVDYSYRRPSRRTVPGVVLPSMQRPTPRVAVVVDTSGSMSDALLSAAWSEVRGCLASVGVRRELTTVYAADTVAHRLPHTSGATVALPGGWGTDMAVAIAEALTSRPELIVVLTDGFTPWPLHRPRPRVVVGLLREDETAEPRQPPPWAVTVDIRL